MASVVLLPRLANGRRKHRDLTPLYTKTVGGLEVSWGEISDIPAGFADRVDDVHFDDLKESTSYWLVYYPYRWALKSECKLGHFI